MVTVLFKTESHFPVKKKIVEAAVLAHLQGKIHRNTEVSVAIIGNRKMRQLNRTYRNLDKVSDVLSFPFAEAKPLAHTFVDFPDDVLRLGDIVVSYPEAVLFAAKNHKLVDDIIVELVLHGLDHLLGIHHEE